MGGCVCLGYFSAPPGTTPITLGTTTRVLGVVPRVLGVVPRVLGVVPRVPGVVPGDTNAFQGRAFKISCPATLVFSANRGGTY